MKKFLLAVTSLTMLISASAQIPTNGLIDHWKLNDNLTNDSLGRPALQPIGRELCPNQSSGLPTITVRDNGDNFIADRNGNSYAAYHCFLKQTNDSVYCNQVPPSGIMIPLLAYETRLETTSDYLFQNTERTIALWAKKRSAFNNSRLFFFGTEANKQAFGLDVKASGMLTLFTWGAGNDLDLANTADTAWHHYAATYDGTKIALYVDGELEGDLAITNLNTGLSKMYFGGTNDELYLDDIRFYNRALTEAEVETFMAAAPVSIQQNNPVQFNLFPNPATDQITIQMNAYNSNIKICDLVGKVIHEQSANGELVSINTSGFANGIYIVQVEVNGAVEQKKVLISR